MSPFPTPAVGVLRVHINGIGNGFHYTTLAVTGGLGEAELGALAVGPG